MPLYDDATMKETRMMSKRELRFDWFGSRFAFWSVVTWIVVRGLGQIVSIDERYWWMSAVLVLTEVWIAWVLILAVRVAHHAAAAGIRIQLGPKTYSVTVALDTPQKDRASA